MEHGYVRLKEDPGANSFTLVPVRPEEVVVYVRLDRLNVESVTGVSGDTRSENYLLVEAADQEDIPARERRFDLVGPLTNAGAHVRRLLNDEDRFADGVLTGETFGGSGTSASCDPLRAVRIVVNQMATFIDNQYKVTYPLRHRHEIFGSEISVRLYEPGRLVEAIAGEMR